MTEPQFVEQLRHAPAIDVAMGASQVKTIKGAHYLHRCERAGLNRDLVLRAIERRCAELGGEIPERARRLIVQAEAVETERLVYEQHRRR